MTGQTAVPCQIRTSLSAGPSHTLTELLVGFFSNGGGKKTKQTMINKKRESDRDSGVGWGVGGVGNF